MEVNEKEGIVSELTKKAKDSMQSQDAMRFSQSALNCAHAFQVLEATAIEARRNKGS